MRAAACAKSAYAEPRFSQRRLRRFSEVMLGMILIGFASTIAAAAGLEAPGNLAGVNLLDEKARKARKTLFGVSNSIHNMTPGNPDDTLQYLWCVEADWKLLLRYNGKDTTNYKVYLLVNNIFSTFSPSKIKFFDFSSNICIKYICW